MLVADRRGVKHQLTVRRDEGAQKHVLGRSIMLPITLPHVKFPPGVVIDLAHFGHAGFGFFGGDEAFAALVLQPGKFAHLLADLH